jgi:hypothetical protein
MAWSVLLLASGDEAAAKRMAGRVRYRSRARQWLIDNPLQDAAPRLRDRARSEQFDAHPSELPRILDRPDVMATGVSAAELVGLAGQASSVEVYAPASHRDAIVDQHALMPGEGPVHVRWVPDEAWALIVGDSGAPRAAVLVDLLESDEPRARREAGRALRS